MDFNFDTGAIFGGLQTLDVTSLPPLGGQAGVLTIVGDGAVTVPLGAQLARPATPAAGMFRFNTDTTLLEYYDGTTWAPLSTSSSTVSSVAANSNSSGLTITGSPITSAGTFQFTLDAGLQALSVKTSTGLVVQTGDDTFTSVSIAGTAGNIDVANGSGVSGTPTINLATVSQGATGNFVKVSLDGFGRVTGNTAVTTSDITTLVDGTYVNITGDTMALNANLTFNGGEILGLPNTPSDPGAAVSKYYVDAVAAGLSWKQAVVASTTGSNIALNNTTTALDTVTLTNGMRVLVKDQTLLEENGIYIVSTTGAWTRSTDMDATTPINEINGAAVYVTDGATLANTGWTQIDLVTTVGTDPIEWSQFSGTGAYTGGTGITVSGNVISLQTPVAVANGGTALSTTPTNGQLLIGNGTGYTLAGLTAGTGVSVTNGSGTITVANTGVTSLAGTANQITASSSTGAVTLALSSTLIVPGTINIPGLTANGAVYVDGSGNLTSVALTDGQILVGDTGSTPVAATISAGTGISVTNGAGTISIANTGVTSVAVSGGTTGLTTSGGPITTTGTITLAGTLAVANGGTGLTALGTANQVLGVDSAGTAAEYKTLTAGTGMSITHGANVVTFNNTGVTSVALSLPGSVFSVTGSPVTTTGTLTGSFASQSANTVFAAPDGSAGTPTFRSLAYADLPLALYVENPSTPTTPLAAGSNAVAIGSGSSASAAGAYAVGAGSSARILGQKAFANGSFTAAGDAQTGLYVARNITTDATLTELFLDGSSTQLVMPNSSVFMFDILVAARRTDATGGGAAYRFVGAARKDTTAGSVTFIGTPSKTVVGETNAAWDAAVSVDTSTGAFRVRVTGEAAKTIRWVATIQTSEVTN